MCEVVKCKRRREGVSAAIKIKSLRQIDGSGSVRVCAIRSEEKKFKFWDWQLNEDYEGPIHRKYNMRKIKKLKNAIEKTMID
jgi:hypothetical protein